MSNIVPIQDIERMAVAVAGSNLFGIKNKEQAIALMLIAQAEGLHPAIAARDYHIIEGKPALKADAMLARFISGGGKVEWHEHSNSKVSATFSHPAGGSVMVDWDMQRAKAAGLDGKQNWKKYPRQMLRARVISEGVRAVYPVANSGLYTPEEVQDFDDKPPMRTVSAEPAAERSQEVEAKSLPAYPLEQFQKNFPAWQGAIAKGKRTPDQIIAMVSSKFTLTDQQKQMIRTGGKQEKSQPQEPAAIDGEWVRDYEERANGTS